MAEAQFGCHEIYTPLHAIDGAVELLLDGSVQKLNSESLEAVALIAESSRQLAQKLTLLISIAQLGQLQENYLACHSVAEVGRNCGVSISGIAAIHTVLSVDLKCLAAAAELARVQFGAELHSSNLTEECAFLIRVAGANGDIRTGEGCLALHLFNSLVERAGGNVLVEENGGMTLSFQVAVDSSGSSNTLPSVSSKTEV